MIPFPQTVVDILHRGGCVRTSAKGVLPEVMKQYAQAAVAGDGHIEFVVGDAVLFPQVINDITHTGAGHVRWDFVSKIAD